jgi:hypothetical protein
METKLSGEEKLRACDLSRQGFTLEEIRAELLRWDVSLMCISRAVHDVADIFARIERARQSGDYSGLNVTETVVALEPDRRPASLAPEDVPPAPAATTPKHQTGPRRGLYAKPEEFPVSGIEFNPLGNDDGPPSTGQ